MQTWGRAERRNGAQAENELWEHQQLKIAIINNSEHCQKRCKEILS